MPATYQPPSHTRPHSTLTVGELIQILAKQPLTAPVVLGYECIESGMCGESVVIRNGCVVLEAGHVGPFKTRAWQQGELSRVLSSQ